MTLRGLGDVVVCGHTEDDSVGSHRTNGDGRARLRFGDECFDDERAAGGQPGRDRGEAGPLAGVTEQVEEGVEGDEDKTERTVWQVVDHVTDDTCDRRLGVVGGQPGEHLLAGVDTDDLKAASGERDGDPPGSDTELEHRQTGAFGSQLGEQVDRGSDIADVVVPIVVDIGEGVAVGRAGVAIHHLIFDHNHDRRPMGGPNLDAVHDGYTYLDHAATTPMRAEAVEAMLPFLSEQFANPSGSHRFARQVRKSIDEARDDVADVLGCQPGDVIFTSGGTEADNTAIFGTLDRRGGVAVCPAVEHHAVLHSVEARHGRIVGVDVNGRVDLDQLAETLRDGSDDVSIVSVMAVNNEVGTITDLAAVAEVVGRVAPRATVHTDAVQAVNWLDLRTITPHVGLLSLSAHKFGGPKGVGLLVARGRASFAPLMVGGGQERERRSGTHNVAGIVAMAVALRSVDTERAAENERIAVLRDALVDGLRAELDGVHETVARSAKVAGSAHVCFDGIENEALLYLLDEANVCASAASACASGAMEPSHVLAAMGVPTDRARGALRLTLGRTTTADDIARATAVVVDSVRRLRRGRAA